MDKFSDRSYKLLFSHPKMVEDLIKSFVKEPFISDIDFSTLKLVKNSFVTKSFRNRESDIIWEVRIKEKEVYIYLLLECQSTIDKFMSLRLLTYIGLFYEHLIKRKKRINKLPPVFPIVLYNGEDRWSSPLEIEELVDIPFQSLKPYIPKLRYYKIAENEFTSKSLFEIENLVSRLFLIETSEVRELGEIIKDVIKILKKEINIELQKDFGLWLRGILRKKNIEIDLSKMDEMEVRPMLLANLEKFEKEMIEKGIEKGMEKGMEKGIFSGRQESVVKMLKKKFKELPENLEEKIKKINSLEKLDEVLLAILDVNFLGEIEKMI